MRKDIARLCSDDVGIMKCLTQLHWEVSPTVAIQGTNSAAATSKQHQNQGENAEPKCHHWCIGISDV